MQQRPSYADGEPIAAIATALSESALAVVRTSGPGSADLVASVFSRPGTLREAEGFTARHGWILDGAGRKIDEVVALVFRAPASYTGEESVELSCHGGTAVAEAVLSVLLAAGFRRALPGEFTFRAFSNGKLDLTRAEAVLDLVSAKTDGARELAVDRLLGAVEREVAAVKESLADLVASAELALDYEEDEGDPAAGFAPGPVAEARDRLAALAASYGVGRIFRDGATVAIAGRPNAGKSSLFNRLLKEERAIVSEIPGTTRDWIEAWISLEGVPVRLVDTAGLRTADDPIERQGVDRTRGVLSGADLVLYVVDGPGGLDGEDVAFMASPGRPALGIWNKIDAGAGPAPDGFVALSAATGAGLHELADRMRRLLVEGALQEGALQEGALQEGALQEGALPEGALPEGALQEGGPIDRGSDDTPPRLDDAHSPRVGDPGGTDRSGSPRPLRRPGPPSGEGMRASVASARQKELLDRAIADLDEALALRESDMGDDLAASALRDAMDALGEITGEISTAELLERMFSRFCVGK